MSDTPDYQSSTSKGYVKLYIPENLDAEEMGDTIDFLSLIINQLERRRWKLIQKVRVAGMDFSDWLSPALEPVAESKP